MAVGTAKSHTRFKAQVYIPFLGRNKQKFPPLRTSSKIYVRITDAIDKIESFQYYVILAKEIQIVMLGDRMRIFTLIEPLKRK